MNIEQVVYNPEVDRWYRHGEHLNLKFMDNGVQAVTAAEAFEKLFGHAQPIPPNVRARRKEVLA
jgi:hypothetical protein